MAEEEGNSTVGSCCGCCWLILAFITFCVMWSNWANLGPDEQVKMRDGPGYMVINGPWSGLLSPIKSQEFRKATILDASQYAALEHRVNKQKRHVEGPMLLFLGADDNFLGVRTKQILERDQYIRLIDTRTGQQRTARGPTALTPGPTEYAPSGVQRAVTMTPEHGWIVLNKTIARQRLVTTCSNPEGVFMPGYDEEILVERNVTRVLPHEAVIVRGATGAMRIYSGQAANNMTGEDRMCVNGDSISDQAGGTAFFLPPYDRLVRMRWTSFSSPEEAYEAGRNTATTTRTTTSTTTTRTTTTRVATTTIYGQLPEVRVSSQARTVTPTFVDMTQGMHAGPKRIIVNIDLRMQKSFYSYDVRTNDNVKVRLDGTIFWNIHDVAAMINMTSDAEGDVWHHSRSILVAAVSEKTFAGLMQNFTDVQRTCAEIYRVDPFYVSRGITVVSMELTRFEPVDQRVKDSLQEIIRQTTQRINNLQKQRSENEVRAERLSGEIGLEANRTLLIETQALNTRLLAATTGASDGDKIAQGISSYLDTLHRSVANVSRRMELFKYAQQLNASRVDVANLAGGNASIYMTPLNMSLKLHMPGSHSEF